MALENAQRTRPSFSRRQNYRACT